MKTPREIWWIVGAALVALIAGSLLTRTRQAAEQRVLPTATSYSSAPFGLRALYLALGQLGYETRRLRAPLVSAALPERGTLVVADPAPAPVSEREWKDLQSWVRRGNTLVLAGEGEMLLFGPSGTDADELPEAPVSYAHPTQPGHFTSGVRALAIRSDRRLELGGGAPIRGRRGGNRDEDEELPWFATPGAADMDEALAAAVEVIGDESGAVVGYARLGAGRLIMLASAWPLSNQGIGRADNFRLVLNLIGARGGPVVFDEYHHGYRDQLAWGLLPLPLKLALSQLVLGLLVAAYARGRRLGPVVPLEPSSRQRTEFLQTMTVALQRGHATRLALRTAYESALNLLHARTGLPRDVAVEVLARGIAADRPDSAAQLSATLALVHRVLAREAPPSETLAISLVRRLDEAVEAARGLRR
jgi:hypothetical protein